MTYGPKLKELQALADAGKDIPVLARRPYLPETLDWVWEAYSELNRGRVYNMGVPYPIALSEIMAYREFANLDRTETEELLGFVKILDRVYFDHLKSQQEQNGGTRSNHRRKRGGKR